MVPLAGMSIDFHCPIGIVSFTKHTGFAGTSSCCTCTFTFGDTRGPSGPKLTYLLAHAVSVRRATKSRLTNTKSDATSQYSPQASAPSRTNGSTPRLSSATPCGGTSADWCVRPCARRCYRASKKSIETHECVHPSLGLHSWLSQQETVAELEFKVELRIEGIAQDVILKDEERMGQRKIEDRLIHEIYPGRSEKTRKLYEHPDASSMNWATSSCTNWDKDTDTKLLLHWS